MELKRIKIRENFYLDELVDPVTYFSKSDNGLSLLDEKAIDCLQLLRTLYGNPITVNNWWFPYLKYKEKYPNKTVEDFSNYYTKRGNFQWSGYRSPRCTLGAKGSAHRFGKAFDPKGNNKVFYKILLDNLSLFYEKGLKRIEDINITKGWMHIDTLERNVEPFKINVVGLKKILKRLDVINN